MTESRSGYRAASQDLLRKAFLALAEDDFVQASEKGWGAAAQMVKATAEARRWRHNGHRQLFDIVKRLVDETGDRNIYDLFNAANSLHSNFYENWMPRDMVEATLEQIQQLLSKLEALT